MNRARGIAYGAVVCLSYFPYPAIAVGNSTGLAFGQILTIALIMMNCARLPKRETLAYLILVLPMVVSTMVSSAVGTRQEDILFKVSLTFLVALMPLIAAGIITRRVGLRPVLTGASIAILIHSVIGAIQVAGFRRGTFPMLSWYNNPSFAPVEPTANLYVTYVRRPFGLFPEPSAMVASIEPMLLLILGVLMYSPAHQGRRRLWIIALVSGTVLCIASRSGGTLLLLAGGAVVLTNWFRSLSVARNYYAFGFAKGLVAIVVLVFVVMATASSLGERASLYENRSWEARYTSMTFAFYAIFDSSRAALVGHGPGQSTVVLGSADILGFAPRGGFRVTAIWSVIARYVMETGLMGVAALGLIGVFVMQTARQSLTCVVLGVGVAWLGGVLVTTSYVELAPIWLSLGLIINPRTLADVFAPEHQVQSQ